MLLVAAITIPSGSARPSTSRSMRTAKRLVQMRIQLNIQNLAVSLPLCTGSGGIAAGADRWPAGRWVHRRCSIVIISSREAIRATAPPSHPRGGPALGATPANGSGARLLPASVPGIATGSRLALSRAIGGHGTVDPDRRNRVGALQPSGLGDQFTALPIHSSTGRPGLSPSSSCGPRLLVPPALLLTMNAFAIWLRNKYQRRVEDLPTDQVTEPQEQTRRRCRATPSARQPTSTTGRLGTGPAEPIFEVERTGSNNGNPAVRSITLDIGHKRMTPLIGPSAGGRSTLIRRFNRMNDLIPSANVDGSILYHGQDLYGDGIHPSRSQADRDGVQKPNPFPSRSTTTSLRSARYRHEATGRHRRAGADPRRLWGEVKDRLKENAYQLSGESSACPSRAACSSARRVRDRPARRARPDRNREDRGPDAGIQKPLRLHRDRHPQHAARVSDIPPCRRPRCATATYDSGTSSSMPRPTRSSPTRTTSGRHGTRIGVMAGSTTSCVELEQEALSTIDLATHRARPGDRGGPAARLRARR